MNGILRRSYLRGPLKLSESLSAVGCEPRRIFQNNKFLTYSCLSVLPQISHQRFYSDNEVERRKLPPLMKFPPVMWPSLIKYIKNWIFANFIIRPYFEREFELSEFVEASKHAVQRVSGALQAGDYKSLEGLVVKEAIGELKSAIGCMSMQQRQMIAVDMNDIFYAVPYEVGVMFDDADKRWVEITMCYHVLLGYRTMKERDEQPMVGFGLKPEFEDKLFILNYRFIREFTKGVEDSWWVNIVNHFQPHFLDK